MPDRKPGGDRRPAWRFGAAAALPAVAALLWSPPFDAASPSPDSLFRRDAALRAFAGVQHAAVTFPGGRVISAEIADTSERVMYGYMYRTEVRDDEGMVFIYPEAGFHSFWMKNTLVPLDIIWLDDDFSIIHMQAPAPPCKADPCPSFGPMRVSRYILEARAGTAARERLKPGDRITVVFPGEAGGMR